VAATPVTINLTITNSCLALSTLQLQVASYKAEAESPMNWSCYNGTEWVILRSGVSSGLVTCAIYEEAIWWKIKNYYNTTMTVSEGGNNVTIYGNCTDDGNLNSTTAYFTIDTTLPVVTIGGPTNISYSTTPTLNLQIFEKWHC
jgi:hypothetical protein